MQRANTNAGLYLAALSLTVVVLVLHGIGQAVAAVGESVLRLGHGITRLSYWLLYGDES